MAYLLGYDIGSSSIKATLLEAETGKAVASFTSPEDTELDMAVPEPGWAEQDPENWWEHIKAATAGIKSKAGINLHDVKAIGIAYQMHGLVLVDKDLRVLRPSIIWCDSRAVQIGEEAFQALGPEKCLQHLLNSPGNFTASKLKWVKENEPDIYQKIYKFMLPGDYIAMKLTGEVKTTVSGLSEGILWDYLEQRPAEFLLDYYGISPDLLPEITPLFSVQGEVTKKAADELGLAPGTKVSYRAGDQPNNAFSLSVLSPGEVAATAGTSGVVYGICDQPLYDKESRVNTFVHVNHTTENPSYGVLLCVNGTGILNRWLKNTFAGATYKEMDQMALEEAPPGSAGLFFYPYGNGAERTLGNKNPGAALIGLDLNVHGRPHVFRAAQEGIVFALNYGVEIMKQMGLEVDTVKAGRANMFLSPLFREVFAMVTGACVELYNTDGSQGAARGAGLGAGIYRDTKEAFVGLTPAGITEPDTAKAVQYKEIYQEWEANLKKIL